MEKYRIKVKGLKAFIEELKQRISGKCEKLRCYAAPGKQYRQNKLFRWYQKIFYQELGGKNRSTQVPPNAEEAEEFWSKL